MERDSDASGSLILATENAWVGSADSEFVDCVERGFSRGENTKEVRLVALHDVFRDGINLRGLLEEY